MHGACTVYPCSLPLHEYRKKTRSEMHDASKRVSAWRTAAFRQVTAGDPSHLAGVGGPPPGIGAPTLSLRGLGAFKMCRQTFALRGSSAGFSEMTCLSRGAEPLPRTGPLVANCGSTCGIASGGANRRRGLADDVEAPAAVAPAPMLNSSSASDSSSASTVWDAETSLAHPRPESRGRHAVSIEHAEEATRCDAAGPIRGESRSFRRFMSRRVPVFEAASSASASASASSVVLRGGAKWVGP